VLTPEEIETANLPRATLGGYDRATTDELLQRVVGELRRVRDERVLLDQEITRLRRELRDVRESSHHEREVMMAAAQRAAEQDASARIEALERVEKVHALVRGELRTVLRTMLDALETPSQALQEALKDRRLVDDLQRITRSTVAAAQPPGEA
jgi:cell division septum initiation protein DivIVA